MASVYEVALGLIAPGLAPTDHYAFSESTGTNVNDTGIANLDLTTNGTVVRGNAPILPGDPSGFSTSQSKDTVLATRGDNVTFDRPATTNKLTLIAWYRPDDVRSGSAGDVYSLIAKGTATYGLHISGGGIRADIAGVTGVPTTGQLSSYVGDLIRVGVPIMCATTFDGAAQTWKLFVNGVQVGFAALPTGQVVGHASGGTLQVGGYNAFSNNGIHGRIQHVTVFNAHALTDDQIQGQYRLGVVPPGIEGDECMYVFPFPREIVASGGNYDTIQFRNWGPWPVHLSQGGTASKGAGITLGPRGGALPKPSKWRGSWSAILDARFGYFPLAIEKTY